MTIALLFVLALAQGAPPPHLEMGSWRATLQGPIGPVPFGLVIRTEDGRLVARIENGAEIVEVPATQIEQPGGQETGWELVLDFPHYDSRVRASLEESGRALSGEWRKRSGPQKWTVMPFHARAGLQHRFAPPAERAPGARETVVGRWQVQFAQDAQPAVAVLREGSAEHLIDGTILTATGDYRYLAGAFAQGKLQLSCFDGAHAFLLTAQMQADGTLAGRFSSGDAYTDTWTASRDADARIPDEMSLARWNDAFGLAMLQYPDLDGNLVSLGDERFAGRVRILQVTGSWCPNCQDETALLAELDRKHADAGLSITALCFEVAGQRERDAAQARKMLARHEAGYAALLAGRSQKALAQQALPALDKVFAFPTTVVLHRDGRVRAVHSGFSGPATGAEHERVRAQFTALVEELLAEPAPEPSVHEQVITHELWRDERGRTFTHFERGEDGGLRFVTMEMTRFDGPTRTDPVDQGAAVIDGMVVRLGAQVLHYDPRAKVMLDAGDVGHRYTPAVRSPFPVIDGKGHFEMPAILEGLSSSDAVRRRESAFYLALQLVQDRHTPPEFGGGQLDPGVAVNLLPLIDDPDPMVRATACWAAGVTQIAGSAEALAKNLQHGFAPVRREAARALGWLRHAEAAVALAKLADEDIDPLVRAAAAEGAVMLRAK